MKKISLAIIATIVLGGISQINATQGIALQNNYGADLECFYMAQGPQGSYKKERKFLAQGKSLIVTNDINTMDITDIRIKTTYLSLMPAELRKYITKIIQEKNMHPEKYAVITINPSTYSSPSWNISISYKN